MPLSRSWQGSGTVEDAAWSLTANRLAWAANAPVVPVFVEGCNSALFHGVGFLHPVLRTLRLPRELLAKRGQCVSVRVGQPLVSSDLLGRGDADFTAAVRAKTYALAYGLRRSPVRVVPASALATAAPQCERELDELPAAARLHEDETFLVVSGRFTDFPAIMDEVGRQRERTFRAVGEGTARERDLDRYDVHYEHFILWHKANRDVAGGYRVGRVPDLLRNHGLRGLYTASLYHFDASFFDRLPPAIELGRSFIAPAYQRQYGSLLALWKGLAQVVVCSPQMPMQLGPVSMSQRYHAASRLLLAEFFAQRCQHLLRNAVAPRRLLRRRGRDAAWARKLVAALPGWKALCRRWRSTARVSSCSCASTSNSVPSWWPSM